VMSQLMATFGIGDRATGAYRWYRRGDHGDDTTGFVKTPLA
jgi:hypothetical protein